MKVRIFCQANIKETIVDMLQAGGFEVSDDGNFDLVEHNYFHALVGLDDDKNQHYIEPSKIVYIDSMGRDIMIHTAYGTYKVNETLENLIRQLPPNDFIRISKSTILRRDSVMTISPSFQMRFKLTLKNMDTVYVTRSYYYNFMDFMNL